MNSLAPKKPVSSVNIDEELQKELIDGLCHQLDHEPDGKKRWEITHTLREASRQFREKWPIRTGSRGHSIWPPLIFAGAVAMLIMFAAIRNSRNVFYYHHPENYLRITRNLDKDGRLFMVQRVEYGKVQDETMMEFCRDFNPKVEAGHVFKWIRFNRIGSCASIAPDDRGFDLVREDKPTFINGKWRQLPIIPKTCHFDWTTPNGHVICPDGIAKF